MILNMEFTRSTQNRNEGFACIKKKNLADGCETLECEKRCNHKRCVEKVVIRSKSQRNISILQILDGMNH